MHGQLLRFVKSDALGVVSCVGRQSWVLSTLDGQTLLRLAEQVEPAHLDVLGAP